MPVGSTLRPAHRGHTRAGRAQPSAHGPRAGTAWRDLPPVPIPTAAAAAAWPTARLSGNGSGAAGPPRIVGAAGPPRIVGAAGRRWIVGAAGGLARPRPAAVEA